MAVTWALQLQREEAMLVRVSAATHIIALHCMHALEYNAPIDRYDLSLASSIYVCVCGMLLLLRIGCFKIILCVQ